MKHLTLLSVLGVLFLAGCEYEVPLTEEHTIPIDPAVLGLWEEVPEGSVTPARMMVLRFSDTEYLVHYPLGDDGMYFRAYPIKIGDVACVQVKVIGAADGPVEESEESDKLFHVVSYSIVDGALTMKTLNTEVVDDDLSDGEALRKAFLENKDNAELFTNPGKFKKTSKKTQEDEPKSEIPVPEKSQPKE